MDSIHEILEGIPTKITDQMNRILVKPVDEHEIKTAVFSMNPNKAPGNDGMSPLFYQTYWEIIKNDIVEAVQAFFHSSHMLKSINHTIVSLIPKIPIPTGLMHYRPISLCSVLCKII